MKAYGYERETEQFSIMRELSVECTVKELGKLAEFFKVVYEQFSKGEHEGWCHRHYRDWDKTWIKEESDVIIITDFGEE